ncbi:MAG: hypothetical protein K2J16_06920 [Clostridia bacterium]|nr:hypothetical protein [Clostridia bacterium]
MRMCNSEAMKRIKELEDQKQKLIYSERMRSKVSYKEDEEKKPSNYDYELTRSKIADIDCEVRKIKHALAKANCTVMVDDFDMTIGEALVYLAQLNSELARLNELSLEEKLSRRITANGVLEYTECLYSPEKAEKDWHEMRAKIFKLQVAIDRANLNNFIEY